MVDLVERLKAPRRHPVSLPAGEVTENTFEATRPAFEKEPDLSPIGGYVEDSGEGRWAVVEALDKNVPALVRALRS